MPLKRFAVLVLSGALVGGSIGRSVVKLPEPERRKIESFQSESGSLSRQLRREGAIKVTALHKDPKDLTAGDINLFKISPNTRTRLEIHKIRHSDIKPLLERRGAKGAKGMGRGALAGSALGAALAAARRKRRSTPQKRK